MLERLSETAPIRTPATRARIVTTGRNRLPWALIACQIPRDFKPESKWPGKCVALSRVFVCSPIVRNFIELFPSLINLPPY